ncbi:MAG: patatin family protein [Bacillota bacterium]
MEVLMNNITDTALIFEGGGMRASYTSGFVNIMLENDIYFDYVAGISAGASNSVNYLTRDTERVKKSFVDLVLEPEFGGWRSFLKGEGYFRARYIYEETPYPGAALPLDFEKFKNNPAKLRIGAFELDSARMRYFTRDDIESIQDLARIVRCSSTLPFFMPPATFQQKTYLDGGLGGGLALDIAKKNGFNKFFVVLTRPRGFRKKPFKIPLLVRAYYRKNPHVADALLTFYQKYNQTLNELEELERAGKAFLAFPDTMPVNSMESNFAKLQESYNLGYQQGQRDLFRWQKFLGIK